MAKNDSFPKREIKERWAKVTVQECPSQWLDNPYEWLANQMQEFEFLLAHAEDGVIWGRLVEGRGLVLSRDVWKKCPPLTLDTLQQVRLFSEAGELMIWRDAGWSDEPDRWESRLILDDNYDNPDFGKAIDEEHILWGTKPRQLKDGFYYISDGQQGLAHVVPVEVYVPNNAEKSYKIKERPLRLQVRHYLKDDDNTGFTRIALSRLVTVYDVNAKRRAVNNG